MKFFHSLLHGTRDLLLPLDRTVPHVSKGLRSEKGGTLIDHLWAYEPPQITKIDLNYCIKSHYAMGFSIYKNASSKGHEAPGMFLLTAGGFHV